MSLAIDTNKVTRVLLNDGWHGVHGGSFDLDSYEFVEGPLNPETGNFSVVHGGGNSGVCATGFTFLQEMGSRISGPLTAILAVRH